MKEKRKMTDGHFGFTERFTELEVLIILLLKTKQVDEKKSFTVGQVFEALPATSDPDLLSTRSFTQTIQDLEQAGMIAIKVNGTASEKLVELVNPGQDAANKIAEQKQALKAAT
jgi:hypothetical protein